MMLLLVAACRRIFIRKAFVVFVVVVAILCEVRCSFPVCSYKTPLLFLYFYLFCFYSSYFSSLFYTAKYCSIMNTKKNLWTTLFSNQSASTMICHNKNLLKWCIKCWLFLTFKFIIFVKWEAMAASSSAWHFYSLKIFLFSDRIWIFKLISKYT